MATSLVPLEELSCTQEREKFLRLSVLLIDGGTKVLREFFDNIHPPSSLSYVLRTREAEIKKNTKLTRTQREVLYHTEGGYGQSKDFDITLLFQLLRCKPLCNLTPPTTSWDKLPLPEDTSPAADMARLKYYRNEIYAHKPEMKVEDKEFQAIWKAVKDAMLRLAISPARKAEWNKMISEYGSAALTHADNDNVKELDQWYKDDLEIKDELANVIQEVRDVKNMIEQRLPPNQSQEFNTQGSGLLKSEQKLPSNQISQGPNTQETGVADKAVAHDGRATDQDAKRVTSSVKCTKTCATIDLQTDLSKPETESASHVQTFKSKMSQEYSHATGKEAISLPENQGPAAKCIIGDPFTQKEAVMKLESAQQFDDADHTAKKTYRSGNVADSAPPSCSDPIPLGDPDYDWYGNGKEGLWESQEDYVVVTKKCQASTFTVEDPKIVVPATYGEHPNEKRSVVNQDPQTSARASFLPEPEPRMRDVIFSVYVHADRTQLVTDKPQVVSVTIVNNAMPSDWTLMKVGMIDQGNGIWVSRPVSIPQDGDVLYNYSGTSPEIKETCRRHLTAASEQYDVFRRSTWSAHDYSKRLFEGQFAFVEHFHKSIGDHTKSLHECLTLTHHMEFGKNISKQNISKVVTWVDEGLTECSKDAMTFLLVVLGQVAFYNPKSVQLPKGWTAMVIDTALLGFAFRDINEIPICAKSYIRVIALLLIHVSRYEGKLAFLAFFSSNFCSVELLKAVSTIRSTNLKEEVFSELLAFARTQIYHASEDLTKEVIARRFSEDAPSLTSLLESGKVLSSVYQSSENMANSFADIFENKCKRVIEPTEVYKASTRELWSKIPDDLKRRVEGSFLTIIIKCISGEFVWDKTKLEFAKFLLLGDVFSNPAQISQIVQKMSVSQCEELLDLIVEVLDVDKFSPTWAAFDAGLKEAICHNCCESLRNRYDKQADTHTVTNTLVALRLVSKTRSVRDNKELKESLSDKVMSGLRERLKSCHLSSFLKAYEYASKDPNVPKKLYIQGLTTAFLDSAVHSHKKLEEILTTISAVNPAEREGVLNLDSFAERIILSVLDHIHLPTPVNDFGTKTDEAIIVATAENAETWISLLSANGSVKALKNHGKIVRIEKSIKWLSEACCRCQNIRVEFLQSLERTTSVESLGRLCAAVFRPEPENEEETSLEIQISQIFIKCKEHCVKLRKIKELLLFCQDISNGILNLVDQEDLLGIMNVRMSEQTEQTVEDIFKTDYWAPFEGLLTPAEALHELKASRVFRNIAIHCLNEQVKAQSVDSSNPKRFIDASDGSEASNVPATADVQRTVKYVAVFLKGKAVVSFQEACNPLFDDCLEMSLNEARIAWKGIDQDELSGEIELVEKYFKRGHISDDVKFSISKMLQLPFAVEKAQALLEALGSFGITQNEDSSLVSKLQNIIHLFGNDEVKIRVIFNAMDEDVESVYDFLKCREFFEVIKELGKAKEFIAFIKEKADENMADLTDAVGDYSEQYVTEQTVSDLIKVHAFLRNVVTIQQGGAMVLLSTAHHCIPQGEDIAAKLQSCRSNTQSLKSLCAENRAEKTKAIIRDFLRDGCYSLTLTSDGKWSVMMCYKGSEKTSGDHTMAYLQDLCSRAHLLVRARKKGEGEFPNYSEFIDEVNLISEFLNVCSTLQQSGHPRFREFKADLEATNVNTIKEKVDEVKHELTKWKKVLRSARDKHNYLNFFYSDQLRILDEFFTRGHDGNSTLSVKKVTFDLLRYVDPSITFSDLDYFLAYYHGSSKGPQSIEDNLGAVGSALDAIFEAQPMFKTPPQETDVLPTEAQDFCVALLEPQSTQTLNAMISLFEQTPEAFPKANQVMLCHNETTMDEVSLFLHRCFGNALCRKPAPLYCMANVECLQSDIQLELVRFLKNYLGHTEVPYKLRLIIRAERHHHIVRHFLEFVLDATPLRTDQELKRSLGSKFPDVIFVTSDLPGLGKTEWVREDATNKGRGVTIVSLSGCVSRDRLVQRLSSLNLNEDYGCLHFDVSDTEDPLALDTLLFEFIGLGLLSHGTKLVHRPTCHIYIEVANTLKNWLQDSFVVCKCFRREHLDSNGLYDKVIVSTEITSPIQVVCHYFHALEEKMLENTDLLFAGPQKVKPLPRELCIDLLSKFYPENMEFTYTRLCTFLKVFADQLLKLSACQFFKRERLHEMMEDPQRMKSEFLWQLFSASMNFIDYGQVSRSDVAQTEELLKVSLQGCRQSKTAEAMVSRVKAMSRWSNTEHLVYIFYSYCMKPLYREEKLVPENVKKLFLSQGLKSKMPDYKNMTQDELREFLEDISDKQPALASNLVKSYVLTLDNIFKMVFILLRLRAKVPVVIMGETGCGKTSLVQFLAQMYTVPFHTFSLHAGTTEEELLSFINEMKSEAKRAKGSRKPVWVFLDEINTCDHLGLISEITCQRRVHGKPLPSNLVFIAACNPYCIRPAKARETHGLVVKASDDELSKLVYRVHPLPEVIMDYVWDFGSLDGKDELSYIQCMTEGLLQDHRNEMFAILLFRSQQFVREAEKTRYCVSLRDIARCKKLFVWFRDNIKNRRRLSSSQIEEHLKDDYEDVAKIDNEERAVVLSLALCYQSRFADADLRKRYRKSMEEILTRGDHSMLKTGDFAKIVRIEEEEYLARMELPPGTAKNAALRENVLVLVSSICNGIPVFVVGKPGCSKSLSMQVIRSNLRGAASPDDFLKSLPQLYVVSFQGSKSSTSGGISKVFEKAHKYKEYNRDSSVLPVVLLDEVGLAERSSRDPLKVLHGLLEPGMDKTPEVAVVGLSNWALDPAKMNRALYLSRPEPTIKDLCETGKSLRHASRGEHADVPSDQELMKMAEAYHRYQKTQTYPNFHGLRDYYSFVRCLSRSLTDAVFSSNGYQCIQEAMQRNFGGVLQNSAVQSSSFMKELYPSLPVSNVLSMKDLICRNIQDRSARHLMLLTAGDSGIHILHQVLQEINKETVTILGSHFENDLDDYDFQVLSEIILHMERDCVLVLRDLESIYGSLYDMLNQNYTTVGGRQNCRVALGPHSVPMCQVHDGFRCVVMKDRTEVDYTDAPFLNRFEKQSLRFEDALSVTQKAACKELRSWATDISMMSDSSLPFEKRDMFLSFNEETIPSLVLCLRQDERLSLEELIQKCKDDLMLTATPDGILRTVKSKWAETRQTEVETMYEDHLQKHNHQGFKAFVEESLATCTSDERKAGLKLVVMTHSSVYQTVSNLLEGLMTCQTATLSLFETQRQFSNFVKSFWMESEASMLILQCRPEVDGCHLPLVQNIIEQQCSEFQKFSLGTFASPQVEKHVCLILHIQKGLVGRESQTSFLKGLKDWRQITVDSLEKPKFPIRSLLGTPVHQIIETHGQLTSEIICDKLLWCFTRIKTLSPGRHSKIVQAIRGSKAITEALKDLVISWLEKSSKVKESAPWLLSVATNQKALMNSSTFHDAIFSYISDFVKMPLAMLVYHLESKSAWNAIVCDQPDDQKISAWVRLLLSENVVNLDHVSLPPGNEFYVLDKPVFNLVHPFSSVFATRVEEIKTQVLANVKTLEEDEEKLDQDRQLIAEEMFALVERFSSQVRPRLREMLEDEWLKRNVMSYVEDLMDLKTVEFTDSETLSRDCRVSLMKAMLASHIRHISTAHDLVLFVTHIHVWFWLNSSLIASVLQVVKECQDLNPSNPRLDQLMQEYSSVFPTTLPEGTESYEIHTAIPRESINNEPGSLTYRGPESKEQAHFEELLVEEMCQMMIPSRELIAQLGSTKVWHRNASFVLSAVTQIFEFGDAPVSFHVLRVCNDFMRLLILPGLASVDSVYSIAKAGGEPMESFLECAEQFEEILLITENCGPSLESQQFLALFFRRCIDSWPTEYATPHEEILSVMIKMIVSIASDVRRPCYLGPVVKLLLGDIDPSVFHRLLHTADPVKESCFLSVLNDALLKLEVEVGIDAHPAVLVCDIIEDYSFRSISCIEATSGTRTLNDRESSEPNPSSATNTMKDFAVAAEVLRQGAGQAGGLRKLCAVAFIRSLLRSVAEYMSSEGGGFLCSRDMTVFFRDLNVFLEASNWGNNNCAPCLFLLRELRQHMSMYDVKRLAKSNTILPTVNKLVWSKGETSKVSSGLLNSLLHCKNTEDAVNTLVLDKHAGSLRKIIGKTPSSHTGVHIFSAVSSIYLAMCHGTVMESKKANIERLAKESTNFNEFYVQLIRCLVGLASFCTPELQLNAESSSTEVQRAFLLTHIAAWMTSAIQDAPINDHLLVALMVNPKLCQESYLPGMPDISDGWSICHTPYTASWSERKCYACRCGVALVASVSQQTCPKCSEQFKPLPLIRRNRSKSTMVPTKGYVEVNPEALKAVWRSVRNLGPPVFRILHLLVHACLYLGYALGIVEGQTLSEFIGIEDEGPSAYCFKHICNDLQVLGNLLNLRQEDAINLIHLVMNRSGELFACDRSGELCKELDAREAWEAKFADSVKPLLSDKDQRYVRLLPVKTAASKSTDAAACLEEQIEEQDCLLDDIAQRNSDMPRLFRSTRKKTTTDLKAAFLNDEDEVGKYPFLRLVFQYENVLPFLRHLIPLLKWTREVESHFSHGITREEAQSHKISTVIFQLQSKNSNLSNAFEEFQEAWRMVLPLLKEELAEDVPLISVDFPVSWCLLDQQENGRFLCSVLKILASLQNEFLERALALANERGCHALNFLGNPQSPNVMPLVPLQECNSSDVICFQWPESDQIHEDDDDGFLSYSQHNTEYGGGWDVHYDLGMIEMDLARTLLWRKAFLFSTSDFREFAYSNEFFHSGANILKEIQDMITQEPLTRDLQSGLQQLSRADRAQVRDLLNRLEVVLCFLKQTQGDPEQPLVEYIEEWISMLTSFPKADLPQPQDRIQLKHAVALYQGLEDILAAKALSGVADDFRVRLPDSKSIEARFSKERNPFSVQAVLTALYRFMYRYLATPRSLSICKEPLLTFLRDRTLWPMEKMSAVSLEEPEIMRLMQELFPEELKVKHIYEFTSLLQRKGELQEPAKAQVRRRPGRRIARV